MKNLLLVFLGGGLGSVSRYLVARMMLNYLGSGAFPSGTFAANILGCFLIGLILASAENHQWISLEWTLLLATGFCGGFTTFSSFAYENNLLLKEANYGVFFLYVGLSLILGLAATFLGICLGKKC